MDLLGSMTGNMFLPARWLWKGTLSMAWSGRQRSREKGREHALLFRSVLYQEQIGSRSDGRLFSLFEMIVTFSSGIWRRRRSSIGSLSPILDPWLGWSSCSRELWILPSRPSVSTMVRGRSSRRRSRPSLAIRWGSLCCQQRSKLAWTTRPSVFRPTGRILVRWFWSMPGRGKISRLGWSGTWQPSSENSGSRILKSSQWKIVRTSWNR